MNILPWLHALVDSVLPPRTRTLRLRNAQALIPAPRTETLLGMPITTLAPYHAAGFEDAVRALKYDGNARAASLLADALADFLREELSVARALSPRPIILVPVPLHTKRRRERGFNQIEKVLSALPEEFRSGTLSRIENRALFRIRATPPQTKLHRSERLHNVRGAFAADEKLVRGAHVFVIDDVCTTGATLTECAAVLTKAGARVSLLAIGRA
jgi:ComF family protein